MKAALGISVKLKKYEALNKALKKWFLILRRENVPVNEPILKEKPLKFANELIIEGFHASEGCLKKWHKNIMHFRLGIF